VAGVPLYEIFLLVAAILAGGVVTGVLAGLFGIGGGGIIVPVLYEVFRALNVPEEVRMQLCVGTSMAIIVPTTIRSYRAHLLRGVALPEVVRAWTIPAVAGVATGAVTAAFAPADLFKAMFVVITTFIAVRALLGREDWRLGNEFPGRVVMSLYGFIIGLASSLMGVSGGSISTLLITLYNKPIHSAVATAAGVGVPIAIAGAVGFMIAGWRYQAIMPPLSIGFVSVIGVALMAPVSSFFAGYGVRLAHALPRRKLEIAFGIFLLLVASRFLMSLVL
jgi:uncharacterized membrane protein YfcA